MEEPFLRVAVEAMDFDQARIMFLDYAGSYGLDHDYLNFDLELNTLEHLYRAPAGKILLCYDSEEPKGACAMLALRAREDGVVELKRLYMNEDVRSADLALWLIENTLPHARQLGSRALVIHLIEEMNETIEACLSLGFRESEAYQPGPEGSIYLYFPLDQE